MVVDAQQILNTEKTSFIIAAVHGAGDRTSGVQTVNQVHHRTENPSSFARTLKLIFLIAHRPEYHTGVIALSENHPLKVGKIRISGTHLGFGCVNVS